MKETAGHICERSFAATALLRDPRQRGQTNDDLLYNVS